MEYKMLKIFRSGRKVYHKSVVQKRSFLSEAYQCQEAWKSRLQSPLLQKFKPEDLFITLDSQFLAHGKVSAVDVDIFANTVKSKEQTEELLNILERLRKSAETTNTLDSTHHAVIRYLFDNDCTQELMNVLHNRLKYGIFPDYVCYNMLMNEYIKKEDYASAAKIAVLPMLQEDTDHLITNALSVYACHKYLENPDAWQKPPEPVEDTKEEIKIRVRYLRNPFFDDHFDLTDPFDLVGKTLAFQGRFMNNALGRTCQLRGKTLCKDSLIEALKNNIKSAVEKQHDIDVNEQLQKYTEWEEKRNLILDKQTELINQKAKRLEIQKLKEEMKRQERYLTFFENEEQIELEIEKIEAREKKEMDKVLKIHGAEEKLKKLKREVEYIPPMI
ncbi:28S ribosomal protein S27, mitochondrial [Melipona quadrifasciata]|uniref:28S ribosomal protein S27, mitochondrial n=1 Tax=Melipona quadrifasciata TaxID=166423 RepID=A0A0M9A280_9HYME|nr:28S ribosomal protein S27, mitochondrial [Melipona quadrifasciata]